MYIGDYDLFPLSLCFLAVPRFSKNIYVSYNQISHTFCHYFYFCKSERGHLRRERVSVPAELRKPGWPPAREAGRLLKQHMEARWCPSSGLWTISQSWESFPRLGTEPQPRHGPSAMYQGRAGRRLLSMFPGELVFLQCPPKLISLAFSFIHSTKIYWAPTMSLAPFYVLGMRCSTK